MAKDNSYPGREPGTPEIKEFEFITRFATGVFWDSGVAYLMIESKGLPSDRRVRQLRYALPVEQAKSLCEALQESI